MTDDELKELVTNLAVSQKETTSQINALFVSQKETGREIKDLSISQKETGHEIKDLSISQKETDRKLNKIAKMIGGISNNQGDVAEDFFYNSLIKNNHLGSLSFDDVTKNMAKHRGKTQEEYDIFLTNGESIAIIEVKYKAHLEDVGQLERKFKNFKKLFPIYKDHKLYGAMASFNFNRDVKDELLKQGYFVVERSGDLINTVNSEYLKVA